MTGEVPFDAVAAYRDEALTHLSEHLELPGFRKGRVPADIALKKIGALPVLEEAVELFIRDFYPELVVNKKLDVVGRPAVQVIKLAEHNPVGLVIRTAVYPEVQVPGNWKDIASGVVKEEPKEATDEEVSQTLESLRINRKAAADLPSKGEANTPLPELNDEFAKSLGAFTDLEDLKAQIKKGIGEEKIRTAKEKRRATILDALLEKTQVAIPAVFVESELEKIMAQLKDDISRMGMQFSDYLTRSGKSEDEVRNEFREQAGKRAKLQLLLNKLAETEKIEVDQEAADQEMKHALEHFPDADLERLRIHIETILRNEKTLRMLEGDTAKKE